MTLTQSVSGLCYKSLHHHHFITFNQRRKAELTVELAPCSSYSTFSPNSRVWRSPERLDRSNNLTYSQKGQCPSCLKLSPSLTNMFSIEVDGAHYMQTHSWIIWPHTTSLHDGFRKAHSCESQLLLTVNDLMCSYDHKIQTDIAVLDFSRAFDTVPHERLLTIN